MRNLLINVDVLPFYTAQKGRIQNLILVHHLDSSFTGPVSNKVLDILI